MIKPPGGNWSNVSSVVPLPAFSLENTSNATLPWSPAPSPSENTLYVASPSPDNVTTPSSNGKRFWSPSPSVVPPSPNFWSPSPSVVVSSPSIAAPSPDFWSPSPPKSAGISKNTESAIDIVWGLLAFGLVFAYCCVIFYSSRCKHLADVLGWHIREDYGRVDNATIELRGADALGSGISTDGHSEDDEDERYKRDIIDAMS